MVRTRLPTAAPASPGVAGKPGRQVASVCGTPIRLTLGAVLFAAWLTLIYGDVLAVRYPQLGDAHWPVASLFPLVFLASVGLHEAGHAVVGHRLGLRVRWVALDGFGGETEFERDAATPGASAAVAAAGPLVSAVLAGVLEAFARSASPGAVTGFLLEQVALGNAIIAAFNLLPGLPLDGGFLLRDGLWKLTGRQRQATVVSAAIGVLLAVAVVVVPMWILSGAGGRLGVVGFAILLVVAAPIATGSWAILREQWPSPRSGIPPRTS